MSNGKFVEAGATQTKENIKSLETSEMLELLADKYADQKVASWLLVRSSGVL